MKKSTVKSEHTSLSDRLKAEFGPDSIKSHIRPKGTTRSFSIFIEEHTPLDDGQQYVESKDRFREYRIMDSVGPPEPEELHAFLRRAADRFIRKWVKEKRDQLTKFERGRL